MADVLSSQLETEKAGADAYLEFERSVICVDDCGILNMIRTVLNLVNSLNLLQTSSRQMGASIGLLSATDHLRLRLKGILLLTRTNAAFLFPRFVKKQPLFDRSRLTGQAKSKIGPSLEQFPDALRSLSKSVNQLMDFLKDFPEFDDEALSGALTACAGDIDVSAPRIGHQSAKSSVVSYRLSRCLQRTISLNTRHVYFHYYEH